MLIILYNKFLQKLNPCIMYIIGMHAVSLSISLHDNRTCYQKVYSHALQKKSG
jgi:hypothetical protein